MSSRVRAAVVAGVLICATCAITTSGSARTDYLIANCFSYQPEPLPYTYPSNLKGTKNTSVSFAMKNISPYYMVIYGWEIDWGDGSYNWGPGPYPNPPVVVAPGQWFNAPVKIYSRSGSFFAHLDWFGSFVDANGTTQLSCNHAGGLFTVYIEDPAPPPPPPTVNIAPAMVTVDRPESDSESVATRILITLSRPSDQSVAVDLFTSDGSAVNGVDYVGGRNRITLVRGQTTFSGSIPIKANPAAPGGESTFYVRIDNPDGATLGNAVTTVTIHTAPQPTISIADTTVTPSASKETMTHVTVALSRPSGRTVTVHYATVADSAVSPRDYGETSGDRTFEPRQDHVEIDVPIAASKTGKARRFFVALSNPQNAELEPGHDRATVTIAGCMIDETVAGWAIQGKAGENASDGASGLTVTAPSGWQVQLPAGTLDYRLPLKDSCSLFRPVVLPDLRAGAGGLSVSAYENTLDDDGVTSGTAEIALQSGSYALVRDLHIVTGSIKADSLEMNLFGGEVLAENIAFSPLVGLTASDVTLVLPEALGDSQVTVRGFAIDPSGSVHGTIAGAEFTIGDIRVKFAGATITGMGPLHRPCSPRASCVSRRGDDASGWPRLRRRNGWDFGAAGVGQSRSQSRGRQGAGEGCGDACAERKWRLRDHRHGISSYSGRLEAALQRQCPHRDRIYRLRPDHPTADHRTLSKRSIFARRRPQH